MLTKLHIAWQSHSAFEIASLNKKNKSHTEEDYCFQSATVAFVHSTAASQKMICVLQELPTLPTDAGSWRTCPGTGTDIRSIKKNIYIWTGRKHVFCQKDGFISALHSWQLWSQLQLFRDFFCLDLMLMLPFSESFEVPEVTS